MASSKKAAKKEPKTKAPRAPKQRRGSAPKGGPKRLPAEQLEVKGAERKSVPALENLDRKWRGYKADQKAASDGVKETAKSIALELRKLPPEYGGKYRTASGNILTVNVKDEVKSKPTSREPRKKKAKPGAATPATTTDPKALPN
jgi:hypothetical protein